MHLISLYLCFIRKLDTNYILKFLKDATKIKKDWPPILQINNPNWLTVNDVVKARDLEEHTKYVKEWEKSVWNLIQIIMPTL